MFRLRKIAMCDQEKRDYQESVTNGQKDAGQSDPNVLLCFACNTKLVTVNKYVWKVRLKFLSTDDNNNNDSDAGAMKIVLQTFIAAN